MPVSNETSISGPYYPNGANLSFPFDFKATAANEVIAVDQDGVTISTALYSVTLDDDEGGALTFAAAPTLDDYAEIYVVGDPALTQPSDFDNAGPSFNPRSVTRAFDRAALRDLKQQRDIDRSIKVPFGETGFSFPGVSDRAGKYQALDALGRAVAASGTGNDPNLRADLAAVGGGALMAFIEAGAGAQVADVQEAIRQAGVYLVRYLEEGEEDHTAAFAKASAAAQALKLPLIVTGGPLYRVSGWVIPRAGGGIDIRIADHVTLKLPDDAGPSATILTIKADNTRLVGGSFDGNIDVLDDGDRYCIKAFSEVVGTPISGVILSPRFAGNCSGEGIFVLGAHNTHAIGVRTANTGLNGISFVTGNTAVPGYDTDIVDCSIQYCESDRRMVAAPANQGGLKFYEYGVSATAKEIIRCTIFQSRSFLSEDHDDGAAGNVGLEIWGRGRDNKIVSSHAEGGSIAFSTAKGNHSAIIIGCTGRRAKHIIFETAAAHDQQIIGGIADCDDFTGTGVSLDFQLIAVEPVLAMACHGVEILKPAVRGILAIAPAPTTPNVWRGENINASAEIHFGTSANAHAVDIQNIKGGSIDVYVDGNDADGSKGVVAAGCRSLSIKVKARRMDSQIVQLLRTTAGESDYIHIDVESLDGTGGLCQLANGGGGSFGNACTLRARGTFYYSVFNPSFDRLSEDDGYNVLSGGICNGTPEGSVVAGPGSMVRRFDGGASTSLYVKEANHTNLGWAGK